MKTKKDTKYPFPPNKTPNEQVEVQTTSGRCKITWKNSRLSDSAVSVMKLERKNVNINVTYLLLTEFEGRTVSYGPSFSLLDLWPKREARGP